MTIRLKLLFLNLLTAFSLFSQTEYMAAYDKISALIDVEGAFKPAVFIVENTFNPNLNYLQFQNDIDFLVGIAQIRQGRDSLIYNGKDYDKVKIYGSIFNTMMDTTMLMFADEKHINLPMKYDFSDIYGAKNWENLFVTKLLATRKGNCHSMPYLYKILCDEFNVPCHLALAPNHVYIKHRAEKGGWFNTELTSASFPMDAWLMASGYISLQSVQNGIYLDTLSEKESIALCVLDLAQGYNHKYPDNDGKFVIECCDLALKHFPDYVNAILLKAETRLKQLQFMQKEMKFAYLKEVTVMPEGKAKWDEMNSLYMQLYKLGYRQMPEQMYVEWLTSLKTEKEKYSNKNAPGAMKD